MASFEDKEKAFLRKPKIRSRCFPCKVMFMAIICPPIKNQSDGKIMLKRISEQVVRASQSYNQNFTSNYIINHKLKHHEWRKLYPKDTEISVYDLLTIIKETYNLDDDVGDDLVLVYYSRKMQKGEIKPKFVKISPKDDNGPVLKNRKIRYEKSDGTIGRWNLKLNDLILKVNPQVGSIQEKDLTCDSKFMMEHIHEIGKSIRQAHSFLLENTPIYLFMDNAGGHGKTEIKKEYEKILKENYNVLIEWQVPQSLETNMLDLGVWVAIQHQVEAFHRLLVLQKDQLAKSVNRAFLTISPKILEKVHG